MAFQGRPDPINRFSTALRSIPPLRGTGPTNIESNDVVCNTTGIRVGADSVGSSILANLIEENDTGVHILGTAWPATSGNHFCGNSTDLDAVTNSKVTLEHDEVCEESAAK